LWRQKVASKLKLLVYRQITTDGDAGARGTHRHAFPPPATRPIRIQLTAIHTAGPSVECARGAGAAKSKFWGRRRAPDRPTPPPRSQRLTCA